MPEQDVAPSLEIGQDLRSLRREWRFERAGWFIIAVLMMAAVAGLFGDGPLARVTRTLPGGRDTVAFDRVVRFGTASTISVSLASAASADTMATVAFDRDYAGSVEIQHIVPEPVETRASGRWVVFLFRRAEPGRPITVDFTIAPLAVGRVHGLVRAADAMLRMRQLVLP